MNFHDPISSTSLVGVDVRRLRYFLAAAEELLAVPAWTTNDDAGLANRSGLVVRRSRDALTNASFRSCPIWVDASSVDIAVFEVVSLDGRRGRRPDIGARETTCLFSLPQFPD